MNEKKAKERRRHPRYDVRYSADVTFNNELLCGTIINISKGGVGILLPKIVPVGEMLDLRLKTVVGNNEDLRIKLRAKIVWMKEKEFLPGFFRAGLEITEIREEDKKILEKHIEDLEKNLKNEK